MFGSDLSGSFSLIH